MHAVLRVAWLVPAFPVTSADPRYVFLAREADALVASGQAELLILSEGEQPGEDSDNIRVHALRRRTNRMHQVTDALCYGRSSWPSSRAAVRSPRKRNGEIWRSAAALRVLRGFRPDVVHSHFAVPEGTCGVAIARASDAASVVSLRGVDLATSTALGYGFRLDNRYDKRFRACVQKVDACLTATSHMRQLALEAGAPPERTLVLPNLLDLGWLVPKTQIPAPAGSAVTILSVGGLRALKGFDRGVRALALLPDHVHYVIVGDGPEENALRSLAAKLGVEHRVHLVGERPPNEVAAWMHTASCYWFTSRWEAFGNVVLEAFASDLPIVATRQGVAGDLLASDERAALLSDPDDPRELAASTHRVLDSRSSRQRDLSAFDPSTRSSKLVDIYQRAIGHAHSRSRTGSR